MKLLNNIYYFLLLAFTFILPITYRAEAIPNIILAVLILVFPFVIKKETLGSWKQNITPLLLLLIPLTICLITIFYNRWEDLSIIKKLITIPAIIILAKPIKNNIPIIQAFILGCFMVLVISSIRIGQFIILQQGFDFSSHANINDILLGERPYVGFCYVLCFILSLHLIRQKTKGRIFYIIAVIIFPLFIFLISARLSLLTLLIVGILSVFYIKQRKIMIIIFLCLITAVSFLGLNENFKKRFTMGFETKNQNIEKLLKYEPRYHIWGCVKKLSKNVPIQGFGFSKSVQELSLCYGSSSTFMNKEQQQWFVDSRFNAHNQFLNFYLASGVFVFLIFILLFMHLAWNNYHNYLALALVLALFLFCLVENVLDRQMGVQLFGICIFFISSIQKKLT